MQNEQDIIEKYNAGERNFTNLQLDDRTYVFKNAVLRNIDFSHTYIFADFSGSDLVGANFSEANVKTCIFDKANLKNSKFINSAIDSATFVDSILDGADFTGASAYGKIFTSGDKP